MVNIRFDSSFFKEINAVVTPTMRKGMADLSKRTAHWGIKDNGDLPLIMGVLNFGDPDHRFLNNKTGVPAPIPKRPWLNKSVQGTYNSRLKKYVNNNLPLVLRGLPKTGQNIVNPGAKMTTKAFIEGLAKLGRDNARESWETANFTANSPATLANKSDSRPLHGNGEMEASKITAWSD